MSTSKAAAAERQRTGSIRWWSRRPPEVTLGASSPRSNDSSASIAERSSGPGTKRAGEGDLNTALIRDVCVDDQQITFVLTDSREVSAPTSWSVRLTEATDRQRSNWRIGGSGTYVEWPAIDEHIGLWTLLGVPEEDLLEAAGFEVRRDSVRT